ncbi:MAG: hypothetical protein ACREOC_15045 [Gemmatimonadales bacterium]
MTSGGGQESEVRSAELALLAAIALAVAGLGFALYLRYRLPDTVDLALTGAQPVAAAPASPGTDELSVVTAAMTVAESLAAAPDSAPAAHVPPAAPGVVTDVVLLPCTEPNPRADGSFLIPPHDPTHRTIVGLPSGPGEPTRGLMIPPHDPRRQNRIAVELVPLDSILEHSVRLPPHDPDRYKLARSDTLPCVN